MSCKAYGILLLLLDTQITDTVNGSISCRTLTSGHVPVQKRNPHTKGPSSWSHMVHPRGRSFSIIKEATVCQNSWRLGGRAAEEVIFGEPEITTGASGTCNKSLR
ncbi:hypothetical protein Droror1_Dr00023860 [Drosera rotundifolia]